MLKSLCFLVADPLSLRKMADVLQLFDGFSCTEPPLCGERPWFPVGIFPSNTLGLYQNLSSDRLNSFFFPFLSPHFPNRSQVAPPL
jgi:hypothetical protein